MKRPATPLSVIVPATALLGVLLLAGCGAATPALGAPASTITVYETVTPTPTPTTAPPATSTSTAATTTQSGPATTINADGVYVLGKDIDAGTWSTTGGADCYYAFLSSTDTTDIINSNNISGADTVTLASPTVAFEISGGCVWSKD